MSRRTRTSGQRRNGTDVNSTNSRAWDEMRKRNDAKTPGPPQPPEPRDIATTEPDPPPTAPER